jgi:PleD family two-component response regulator
VREHNFRTNNVPLSITVSFGVATIHPGGLDPSGETVSVPGFISQADSKLYEAKQYGRDRVCA